MNLKAPSFDSGFGPDVGQGFKQRDKFRPAIRITAVIDRVHAEKNVGGADHFRPGEGVRQKNRVPGRYVSDRNSPADFFFRTPLRDIDIGRERRPKDALLRALESHERSDLGMTAPPDGLCLERVIIDLHKLDSWPPTH